jgi:hypothetical protein
MKIDRELVRGIHRNSYKQNLVKAISEYSSAYIDLDRFKEYNDHYGFSADDFVVMCEKILDPGFFAGICSDFDLRKKKLFYDEDVQRGSYLCANRKGVVEEIPLVTLSIGVVTNENFERRIYSDAIS